MHHATATDVTPSSRITESCPKPQFGVYEDMYEVPPDFENEVSKD
jgi:hypothetical protein